MSPRSSPKDSPKSSPRASPGQLTGVLKKRKKRQAAHAKGVSFQAGSPQAGPAVQPPYIGLGGSGGAEGPLATRPAYPQPKGRTVPAGAKVKSWSAEQAVAARKQALKKHKDAQKAINKMTDPDDIDNASAEWALPLVAQCDVCSTDLRLGGWPSWWHAAGTDSDMCNGHRLRLPLKKRKLYRKITVASDLIKAEGNEWEGFEGYFDANAVAMSEDEEPPARGGSRKQRRGKAKKSTARKK